MHCNTVCWSPYRLVPHRRHPIEKVSQYAGRERHDECGTVMSGAAPTQAKWARAIEEDPR
jgi:hypothetical protein